MEHCNEQNKSKRRYDFGNLADLVDSETSDNEQNTEHSANYEKSIIKKKRRLVVSESGSDQDKENDYIT